MQIHNQASFHKDTRVNSNFDIIKNEFLPIYIGAESVGQKLTNLRLKNNITRKHLANEIEISQYRLKQLEENKLKNFYYYAHIYCRHFNINPISYLEFNNMKEDTTLNKIEKVKALYGYRTHKDIAKDLKINYRTFTRYLKNDTHKLDALLNLKLKEQQ